MFPRTASPRERAFFKWVARIVWAIAVGLLLLAWVSPVVAQTIPREALRYQRELKREAQRVWGLDAPVATFAAQIHQESRWRADARSPVGAQGLTQFMPGTAAWMGSVDAGLAGPQPLNPTWAIRALVVYDQWIWKRIKADDLCEHMAFTLSWYNGGGKWLYRRQALSPVPGVCMGATCTINPGIRPEFQRENEHYPRVILMQYEPLYALWGPGSCNGGR